MLESGAIELTGDVPDENEYDDVGAEEPAGAVCDVENENEVEP